MIDEKEENRCFNCEKRKKVHKLRYHSLLMNRYVDIKSNQQQQKEYSCFISFSSFFVAITSNACCMHTEDWMKWGVLYLFEAIGVRCLLPLTQFPFSVRKSKCIFFPTYCVCFVLKWTNPNEILLFDLYWKYLNIESCVIFL